MCNKKHFAIYVSILLLLSVCAIVTVNGCTELSHNDDVILVVVTAHNCESCTATDDSIYFISHNYPDIQVKTVEIHNPEGAMYVSRYRIWRVPVYLFIDRNGNELYRLEGEQNRSQLKEAIVIAKARKHRN
ncbi:MAG: thioredoxin domain-containing protein [Spirochaetes bacterium]|nr:thioredoxin domain-containing protein [Spirochaetota bacterium]